jgi:hypothetical protein
MWRDWEKRPTGRCVTIRPRRPQFVKIKSEPELRIPRGADASDPVVPRHTGPPESSRRLWVDRPKSLRAKRGRLTDRRWVQGHTAVTPAPKNEDVLSPSHSEPNRKRRTSTSGNCTESTLNPFDSR